MTDAEWVWMFRHAVPIVLVMVFLLCAWGAVYWPGWGFIAFGCAFYLLRPWADKAR